MSTGKLLRKVVRGMMISAGAVGVYLRFVRPWLMNHGATDLEIQRSLPGDTQVKHPLWTSTQAITIHATPSEIWPWLAQWGYERGGFYSYDWVDRLVGAHGLISSDLILPQFQNIQPGDWVPVSKSGGFVVRDMEKDCFILLENRLDLQTAQQIPDHTRLPETYVHMTWLWYLQPLDEKRTRLISRIWFDTRYQPSLPGSLFMGELLKPGSAIMDWRMLRGIKCRTEGSCLAANDA